VHSYGYGVHCVLKQFVGIELSGNQSEPAGLAFGKVQNVIDDSQ